MPTDRFQKALEEISNRFAMEVVQLIRTTTLDELTSLARVPEPAAPQPEAPEKPVKRRGRPPKKAAVSAPDETAEPRSAGAVETTEAIETTVSTEVPEPKPKKKRVWPKCSVDGCDKNVYMPSGARKMCYQHNLAHGGKPTPLAKVNKARQKASKGTAAQSKAPATAAPPEAKKPRTIRRKKADKARK